MSSKFLIDLHIYFKSITYIAYNLLSFILLVEYFSSCKLCN